MKQKDIAKILNTSISTVSRVLSRNDTRSISEELKQQIIAMAIKNKMKIKTKKYGILVGSYFNTLDDPFYGEIVQHAAHAFQEMSYYRSFHCTSPELEKISDVEMIDRYGRLDGVIIVTMTPKKIMEKIVKLTDNIVYIGEVFAFDETMNQKHNELPDFPYDRITYDSYSMFTQCVEYLVSLGRKKIIFIGIEPQHKNVRISGYINGLSKTGLESTEKIFFPDTYDFNGGYHVVDEFYNKVDFDAVMCHNDEIALGLMERLLSLGVKIPDDVMVTGFYDMPQASLKKPSLTTIRIDVRSIGFLSAEIINARAEKILNSPVSVKLGLELVKRESTGGVT